MLAPITNRWDVSLIAFKGFSSKTFLYDTARHLRRIEKPKFIYYFGDYDPSGVCIDTVVRKAMDKYGAGDFEFRRVAVTAQQIEDLNLPGSPPKKGDSRSKDFEGMAVELESIDPVRMRQIAEGCIRDHIDADLLDRHERVERLERETLATFIESLPPAA